MTIDNFRLCALPHLPGSFKLLVVYLMTSFSEGYDKDEHLVKSLQMLFLSFDLAKTLNTRVSPTFGYCIAVKKTKNVKRFVP